MIKDNAKREEFIRKCTNLYNSYLARNITQDPLPDIHVPGDVIHGGNNDGALIGKSLGHKSAKSVVGKIIRDRQEEGDNENVKKISVSSISDLTRCTIVIDSFDRAAETIKKMAEKFKYLRAGISNKKISGSGYQGIHLKGIDEQGVNYEIQIHTPETLLIKKISDCEYIHWRNFNLKYEIDQADKDEVEIAQIMKRKECREKDDQDCREIYEYLYEITDNEFDRNISEIEAAIIELNNRFESQIDKPNPNQNKEISKFADLSKFEIKGNVRELKEQKLIRALTKSKLFKKVLPEMQLRLVETCESISAQLFTASVERISKNELNEELNKLKQENASNQILYEPKKTRAVNVSELEDEKNSIKSFGE